MTSTNGPSQLPVMLKQHGSDILVEWVQQQIKNTQRRGLIKEAELQEQSREFLAAFTEALQQGTDINAPAWSAVREVLGSVSRSRARQGFTPSETAMFIFSLKLPLFSMLRRELGNDGTSLADELWNTTTLLDELGVDYDYIDLETDVAAADKARAISGRTNIPVIVFPDDTHFVEPGNDELREKVAALGA